MPGKRFARVGILLLAGAVLLATPGSGRAAHGGGHFGGASFGGAHFGAHLGAGNLGGYRGGFYHYGNHYGYSHAYGYSRSYPHYGSYPYRGFYSYSPYYGAYGYRGLAPGYASGYYAPGGYAPPTFPDDTTPEWEDPPPSVSDTRAQVTVELPANAQLWFDGTATTSTGLVREFNSPPLEPGSRYSYEVRARWDEKGHTVTQTQKVEVTAGAHVQVTFPIPPRTAGPSPAPKEG
jgi:uncharacterized protein (TIGR03000 family)